MRWVAVLLLLCVGCAGCGRHAVASPTRPRTTLPPVLLGVGGHVVVTDLDAVRYTADGSHCVTVGRYADVKAGARVLLSGTRGSVAAVTQLGQGVLRSASGNGRPGCSFPFSTSNVPNRHPAFLVYVADRKGVRVEPRDLSNGSAQIVLG